MPTVSVVIPVFNGQKHIHQAIDSVHRQTYQDTEIIVVDDGSTDSTAEIVATFKDSVSYLYQTNSGAAKARNSGVRASRGKYIAFLDNDDAWLSHKLERQVRFLEEHTGIDVVTADMQCISEEGAPTPELVRGFHPQDPFCRLFLSGFYLLPSVTCMRRAAFDRCGGFAEGFAAAGAEDVEFMVRLMDVSKAHYMEEVLTYRRHHPLRASRATSYKNLELMLVLLIDRYRSDPIKRHFLLKWKASLLSDRGKDKIADGDVIGGRRDLVEALTLMVEERILGKKTMRTVLRLARSYLGSCPTAEGGSR